MKRLGVTGLIIFSLIFFCPRPTYATSSPQLVISQFKITSSDGQFFMLYNATDLPIDMATVQLTYYNHYNLASATSSKVIPLSGSLPAHGFYLVNDGPLTLCYKMMVNSLTLGLSSTAGSVQVSKLVQASPGAPITNSLEDSVSWSKTVVTGVTQLPTTGQFLLRNPLDSSNNPSVASAGAGSWQNVSVNSTNPCLLTSTNVLVPAPVISTSLLLLSSTPPPVTVISLVQETTGPYLPASDIGLMAPVINELLPNPGSPLADANDEFIELYNPNDKPFDLTGFELEVGLTTKRTWRFPDGTILSAKSFTAFTSAQTGLSLSNSGGLARLLDPFGNSISASEEYGTAKDNQTWALANNEWFWTIAPTPGLANTINAGGTAAKKTKANGPASGVKGTSTSTNPSKDSAPTLASATPEVATLHPSALASVAVLAVGYGAYEYKQDITNKIRRLRADRANRPKIGGKP